MQVTVQLKETFWADEKNKSSTKCLIATNPHPIGTWLIR